MVFAIETYWPTPDGSAAARIEEEVVVTSTGCELLTRFPADQLYVAGTRMFNGLDFPAPTPEASDGSGIRVTPHGSGSGGRGR
jgi:hypothetical protein